MGSSAQQLTEQYVSSSQTMASLLMGSLDLKLGLLCSAEIEHSSSWPTPSGVGLLLYAGMENPILSQIIVAPSTLTMSPTLSA
jgi:hypothetical protein